MQTVHESADAALTWLMLVCEELLRDFLIQRIQALVEELLGVILSPILLIFFFPDSARSILDILGSLQHSSPNLGDWCRYGCLDVTILAENSGGAASSAEGCRSVQLRHMDNNEKLEKSVLSFCLNHQLIWPSASVSGNTASWVPKSRERCIPGSRNAGGRAMTSFAAHSRTLGPREIQLEELNAQATQLPEEDVHGTPSESLMDVDVSQAPVDPQTESSTSPAALEEVLTHIIGVPLASINLLHDVQDFHEKETSEHPPSGDSVTLLPPDLVSLPPLAPGVPPSLVTSTGRTGDEPESWFAIRTCPVLEASSVSTCFSVMSKWPWF